MGTNQSQLYPPHFSSCCRVKFSVKHFSPDLRVVGRGALLPEVGESQFLRVTSVIVADRDVLSIWLVKIVLCKGVRVSTFPNFAKFWWKMTFLLSLKRVGIYIQSNCTERIKNVHHHALIPPCALLRSATPNPSSPTQEHSHYRSSPGCCVCFNCLWFLHLTLVLLSEKLGQLKKHIQGARRVVSRGGVSKAGSPYVKVPTHPAGNVSRSLGTNWEQAFFCVPLHFGSWDTRQE